jgi:hypothetical protein
LLRKLFTETKEEQNEELRTFLLRFMDELKEQSEGIQEQTNSAHVRMFYSERKRALPDMARAIQEAEDFVYIMGVSCKEFFCDQTECRDALSNVLSQKPIRLRVLILDWSCNEAFQRSKREQDAGYTGVDDPRYKESSMFSDTMQSRNALARLRGRIRQNDAKDTTKKHEEGGENRAAAKKTASESRATIECHIYDDISLFLVITENVVFMEPYHYGNRREESVGLLEKMAELVPVIAFDKTQRPGPYHQFKGHFDYVFEHASVDDVRAEEPDSDPVQQHPHRDSRARKRRKETRGKGSIA